MQVTNCKEFLESLAQSCRRARIQHVKKGLTKPHKHNTGQTDRNHPHSPIVSRRLVINPEMTRYPPSNKSIHISSSSILWTSMLQKRSIWFTCVQVTIQNRDLWNGKLYMLYTEMQPLVSCSLVGEEQTVFSCCNEPVMVASLYKSYQLWRAISPKGTVINEFWILLSVLRTMLRMPGTRICRSWWRRGSWRW